MNLFEYYKSEIIKIVKNNEKELNILITDNYKGVLVETPPENIDFDLSCNISLILGKLNKKNPNELANEIKIILQKDFSDFDYINTAAPGFLNIKLSDKANQSFILNILKNKKFYGSTNKNINYNIEFVSANPTGPLHIGHCRGAIFGDTLSNLLEFNGNKVTKEYYINDYGNQIKNFTKSVYLRIREILFKESFKNEKDLYPGEYVIEIAKNIIKNYPKQDLNDYEKNYEFLSREALNNSMNLIKLDLKKLGISHNKFVSEKELVKKKLVNEAAEKLKKNNFTEDKVLPPPKGYSEKKTKNVKRLVFKSTLFGDDIDRALQKDDGSWTYFANDIAYHLDKIKRNYDVIINVLGADHTGYVKRIKSAVDALSKNKIKFNCKVTQLVKLFKNGKPFKMSKRSGDFISVNDLLNQVNKDAIRFMMLNRSNDVELDFDFGKVLEKTKDNPVFYVQYCYARINSIYKTLKISENKIFNLDMQNFNLNEYEVRILRKIYNWPKIIETASNKLEPHRIPFYLYDLATIFHSYWSKGNEDDNFKFIYKNKIKSNNTLAIIQLVETVIKNGMTILGVSLPKKM